MIIITIIIIISIYIYIRPLLKGPWGVLAKALLKKGLEIWVRK